MSAPSFRVRAKEAAALLEVSLSYLHDVLEDFHKHGPGERTKPAHVHTRMLSSLFYKDTDRRWYIARPVIEKAIKARDMAVLYRDSRRASETLKQLESVGL